MLAGKPDRAANISVFRLIAKKKTAPRIALVHGVEESFDFAQLWLRGSFLDVRKPGDHRRDSGGK